MALLEDITGGIGNFFGGLLGGGGQTGQTAEGVQPQQQATDLLSMMSPEDQRRMTYSLLGQLGSTLLAAGQKQMPGQRAQYLAQLGAIPGNVQREAMGNLQARMMQSQLAERLQNQQSLAQINNLMKDPAAFKQAYGFDLPPGMSAAQVQNIVQQRATSQFVNPLARQIQEAQYADILANREKAITQLETQKQQLGAIGGDTSQIDAQINTLRRIYGGAPAPAAAPVAPAPTPMLVTPAAPAAAPAVTPGGVVQPSAPAAAPTAEQPSAAPVTPPAEAPAEVAPAAPPSLFTPPAAPATPAAKQGAALFGQFTQIPQAEVRQRLQAAIGAGKFQEEYSKLLKEERDQLGEEGKRRFDQEGKLRDSFNAATKDFSTIQTAYKTMEGLAQNAAGTSDLTLVMSLYKIYDPGSVVSMNESGQIIGTDSAVGKFQAFANSMMTGQKLRPEIRDQVLDAARSRFREVYNDYDRRVTQNNTLAEKYGLQPDRVVIDVREPELQQQMDALNQRDKLSKSISVDAISNASLDDLNLLNKRVLNANQMAAVKKRLEELGQPPAPPASSGTGTSMMGPPMPPPMIKPLGGSLSTLGNKQLLPLGFGQ
jgi:hypothetical protein